MILENYICSIILVVIGVYAMIKRKNLVKIVIGMAVMGFGINLLTITIGYNKNGTAPVFTQGELMADSIFVDPIPQVLALAVIIIGACFIAVSLSLIVKFHEKYGTLDADRLRG